MYFVVIDLHQLHTRLANSTRSAHPGLAGLDLIDIDVDAWLRQRQFVPAAEGYLATAEAMNRLSCSEILYSERRLMPLPRPVQEYQHAAG